MALWYWRVLKRSERCSAPQIETHTPEREMDEDQAVSPVSATPLDFPLRLSPARCQCSHQRSVGMGRWAKGDDGLRQ